jgi:UDP-N-acetylglucosamine 2-epimerase
VTEPLGYLDMLRLMSSAEKMITDSGGIQKEATSCACRALPSGTRRMDRNRRGWLKLLVGTDMKNWPTI